MICVQNILVPTDFEQTSALALSYGRELARLLKANLTLLHVADDTFSLPAGSEGSVASFPSLQTDLEERVRSQIESLITDEDRRQGTRAAVLISSQVADAIVQFARGSAADLIIMGTHGRGGASPATIGSVAERVVRTAPCPVLTVRRCERDFVAPGDVREIAAAQASLEIR